MNLQPAPPSVAQRLLQLTASVLEATDGVGQQTYAAQKSCALFFVDLLMVPHTDGDRVSLPDIPERGEGGRRTQLRRKGELEVGTHKHVFSLLFLKVREIKTILP